MIQLLQEHVRRLKLGKQTRLKSLLQTCSPIFMMLHRYTTVIQTMADVTILDVLQPNVACTMLQFS